VFSTKTRVAAETRIFTAELMVRLRKKRWAGAKVNNRP